MLKRSEEKVVSSGLNVSDFIEGETGAKVDELFGVIETFTKNTSIAKLVTTFTYLVSELNP